MAGATGVYECGTCSCYACRCPLVSCFIIVVVDPFVNCSWYVSLFLFFSFFSPPSSLPRHPPFPLTFPSSRIACVLPGLLVFVLYAILSKNNGVFAADSPSCARVRSPLMFHSFRSFFSFFFRYPWSSSSPTRRQSTPRFPSCWMVLPTRFVTSIRFLSPPFALQDCWGWWCASPCPRLQVRSCDVFSNAKSRERALYTRDKVFTLQERRCHFERINGATLNPRSGMLRNTFRRDSKTHQCMKSPVGFEVLLNRGKYLLTLYTRGGADWFGTRCWGLRARWCCPPFSCCRGCDQTFQTAACSL